MVGASKTAEKHILHDMVPFSYPITKDKALEKVDVWYMQSTGQNICMIKHWTKTSVMKHWTKRQ